MKKFIAMILVLLLALSTFGALAASKSILINKKNFPDPSFRGMVGEPGGDYDINGDGKLSASEIKKIDWVHVVACDIGSLTGIEFFTNIRGIDAGGNNLKKLDVRKNTKLLRLICGKNKLTKLTLGTQKYLNYLDCASNKGLKKLDIGGCKNLLKLVKTAKKTMKGGTVQWKLGKDINDLKNYKYLCIPASCTLYNGKVVLYKGK